MSNTKFKPMGFGSHSHSDHSLDGATTVKQRLLRAHSLGRPADCITDHGVMSGLMPHYFESLKLKKDKGINVQSIHGIELYVIDEMRPKKIYKNLKEEWQYSHLTVLFKTRRAYEYMCSMTAKMEERAIVKFGERKPLIFLRELEPIAGEIIIGTSCCVGYVTKNINDWSLSRTERYEYAERAYKQLKEISGTTPLMAEVFPHSVTHNWTKPKDSAGFFYPILEKNHICGSHCQNIIHTQDKEGCTTVPTDLQKSANLFIIEMARKYGDLLQISEDSHLATEEDYAIQEQKLGNGQEKWKFHVKYTMESSDTWAEQLKHNLDLSDRDIEEYIDNSHQRLDEFKNYTVRTNKDGWLLPTQEMVYDVRYKGKSNKEILMDLIDKHGRMPSIDDPKYNIYKERLDYEISIFADTPSGDFIPYFFPIEDLSDYARKNDILIICRGSMVGSLVAYLLRISFVDPVLHDLPVERAITPGRLAGGSLMDADIDCEDRDLLINYAKEKYGDSVTFISTELLLKLKSSLLDVERAEEGVVSEEIFKLSKSLPNPPQGVNYREFLFGYKDKETEEYIPGFLDSSDPVALNLKAWAERFPKKWDTILRSIGIIKSKGVHAGGVLIMPDSCYKFLPLITTGKGLTAAYDMKNCENIGAIKYDLLGVETLRALSKTLKLLKKRGIDIEWKEFPHDENVYKNIYHKNKMAGVFQTNTNSMKPFVQALKPSSIPEGANLISVVRPTVLDAPSPVPGDTQRKAAQYYVECHQKISQPYFIHDDLRPIIGDTYGIYLLQEQAMRTFRDLAGYTYETGDEIRRGIGKKQKDVLEVHMPKLKSSCIERGWTEEQADLLVKSLMASARYGFNKAHAFAYFILSYNCAWLKYHYELEYFVGMLTIAQGSEDVMKDYLSECGHLVLPVSIIHSHPTEWLIEGERIRAPLSLVKGCGGKTVTALQTFINTSLDDLKNMKMDANIDEDSTDEVELSYDDALEEYKSEQ